MALCAAALALAPAALARGGGGGGHGGGGGGRGGGGGGHASGGGGHVGGYSGGGSRGGNAAGGHYASGGSRGGYAGGGHYGSGGSRGGYGGGVRSGGWVTHSGGTHYSATGARYGAGHPSGGHGPAPGHGSGYGHGYGHGGYPYHGYGGYYPYWGWASWGWGWGWGWAPYWSSWWWGWGGGWPGGSYYVSPGMADGYVDVGVRRGRYAIVKTDVSPEEAQVYLDDKYIGSADDFDGIPDFLYLGPGKYHLEFRMPNYMTYATDLDVTAGQQVKIDEKLKLEPGKSALDAFPPESKGTPLGRVFTKGGAAATAAPRGDDGWSDRESAPAYRERSDEERTDLRVDAAPRPSNRGRIKFQVAPDDAAVYMDDKYLGAADDLAANPRGIVAEPGTHTITVTRPGYKSKTVEVTTRAGSPVDVVVELEK